ncbi:hypothetical protein ADEAN_000411300 [Angomonas deanei]|uniref:Uncharacterized protein n=1 Tax=Angomonas deanei TaxID=59799 RepID=A0A7G2CC99_9TRYP|nr:hypothetical protein ADEAN_000411300 [Angomonas deanei]
MNPLQKRINALEDSNNRLRRQLRRRDGIRRVQHLRQVTLDELRQVPQLEQKLADLRRRYESLEVSAVKDRAKMLAFRKEALSLRSVLNIAHQSPDVDVVRLEEEKLTLAEELKDLQEKWRNASRENEQYAEKCARLESQTVEQQRYISLLKDENQQLLNAVEDGDGCQGDGGGAFPEKSDDDGDDEDRGQRGVEPVRRVSFGFDTSAQESPEKECPVPTAPHRFELSTFRDTQAAPAAERRFSKSYPETIESFVRTGNSVSIPDAGSTVYSSHPSEMESEVIQQTQSRLARLQRAFEVVERENKVLASKVSKFVELNGELIQRATRLETENVKFKYAAEVAS